MGDMTLMTRLENEIDSSILTFFQSNVTGFDFSQFSHDRVGYFHNS
jgi:hypothetical protein